MQSGEETRTSDLLAGSIGVRYYLTQNFVVRLEYQNGEQVTFMLQPDNDKIVIPGETSIVEVIELYTILGFEHILFGLLRNPVSH